MYNLQMLLRKYFDSVDHSSVRSFEFAHFVSYNFLEITQILETFPGMGGQGCASHLNGGDIAGEVSV